MPKGKENNISVDITQLGVEDLKKMNLDDILIYINELEDTRTVIIYFFKIIKQMTDESNSNHKLTKFRKRFRETNDLEERLDEIYSLIEENNLLLDLELDTIKNSIELKLARLKIKDLKEINDLEVKKLKIPYETALREYNNAKESIRSFFSKICTLYTNTMQELDDQKRAKEDSIEILKELSNTPQISTGIPMGDPYEQIIYRNLERAGQINREHKLAKIYEKKSKKFNEEQERLKKERGMI